MDAVSALMQERQRFEAWIIALEEKRAITPPHVYERVRGDYEVRLREVIQKLGGRTTELRDTIAALTARLAKLQTEENAKRDERYEAELRATVGEFESDKWEALRRSIDDTITRLASERTSVSTELARVQQILSMAGTAAGGAAPGADGQRPPAVDQGASRGQGGRFDELAFLSSVVESAPGRGAPSNGSPPSSAGNSPPGQHGYQPSGSVPPSAGVPEAPPRQPSGRQPVQPAQPASTATRQPTGSNQAIQKPENTEGAVPSYLRDVPTETAKSLKCQECGTMNNPTEWYCERCGGELAAM
jgi:hypothetical protein